MASVNFSFTLDSRDDRDVIAWLEEIPRGNKSAAIRDALRAYLEGQGITLADVYQEIVDVKRKLDAGTVINNNNDDDEPEEPPELAAALDNLGL